MKQKNLLRKIVFGVVVLFGFIFSNSVVYAQSSSGVSLQPVMFEQEVEPGEVYSLKLNVTNKGAGEATYYFVTKNISGVDNRNAPIFAREGEATGLELTDWVKFPQESLTVGGGETEGVVFELHVPTDATPGGHFGGIFVSLIPVRPETSGTGIGFQVGTILSMQVEGDVFEEVEIREFVTGKTLYSKPEIDFRINVDNIGNVLARPFGPLQIIDMFDKEVGNIVINKNGSGVFPGTRKDFETVWSDTGFRFGKYQAIVSLTYGLTDKRTVSSVRTFWILPMNIVGPILGVLLVLVLAIYFGIKITLKKKMEALHRGSNVSTRKVVQQKSRTSRAAWVSIVLLAFTILFLIVLFVLFA